jgi:hypothetical protein
MPKQYIGNGVYARIEREDRWLLILTTEDGYQQPSNTIYFEPETWEALVAFIQRDLAAHKLKVGEK